MKLFANVFEAIHDLWTSDQMNVRVRTNHFLLVKHNHTFILYESCLTLIEKPDITTCTALTENKDLLAPKKQ